MNAHNIRNVPRINYIGEYRKYLENIETFGNNTEEANQYHCRHTKGEKNNKGRHVHGV
jgi:hypothetical protein